MFETRKMSLGRFARLLDIHGSDPSRWPRRHRSAALAFAESDLDASLLLREARALDALLDRAPTVSASPEVRDAILAAIDPALSDRRDAERQVQPWQRVPSAIADALWPGRDLSGKAAWQPAATVLTVCLGLGMVAGQILPVQETSTSPLQTATSVETMDSDHLIQLALLSGTVPYNSQSIRDYIHEAH